jgi:hypothetical protein
MLREWLTPWRPNWAVNNLIFCETEVTEGSAFGGGSLGTSCRGTVDLALSRIAFQFRWG